MLTLFSFIKIAHQLQHNSIITIIKEFNLNNPYFIGSVDKKLDLLKALSRNGQFWNIHPSIENIFVNAKITKNSILLPKSQGKNNYHLDFPKNPYWSCLLISESKNFEDLLNIVAAQTDISQKVFILKHDSHEIYEEYASLREQRRSSGKRAGNNDDFKNFIPEINVKKANNKQNMIVEEKSTKL